MRKSLAVIGLLAAFLTSGCATLSLTAEIGRSTHSGPNEIENVTAAYRDSAGNVTVCVKSILLLTSTGRIATMNEYQSRSSAITKYSFRFPAASAPKLEASDFTSIMRYRSTKTDIQQNCPDPEDGMTPLAIHTMDAPQSMTMRRSLARGKEPGPAASGKRFIDMPDNELTGFFENRVEGPAIYRLVRRQDPLRHAAGTTTIVYVHDSPAFENKWAVEIDATLRKPKAIIPYYLLLPFAVIFDVVTLPVQMMIY